MSDTPPGGVQPKEIWDAEHVFTFTETPETRGRPRKYFTHRAATGTETKAAFRQEQQAIKYEHIAILDTETDPFDSETQDAIKPFAACIYSDNFDPIIIWDDVFNTFIAKLIIAIETLPDKYVIYAHNGGKFDYMFFIHKLRGRVSFKGRGIMSARLGNHELRDSFHILPEKLAAFHKETFDYQKMRRTVRHKYKDEIIEYLISDCRYLLELVQGFVKRFGFKLSIGMAAMANLKKFYKVGKLGDLTDQSLRRYFYGGRVECLAGRGHFVGKYKIFDVNSMYSAAGSYYQHPISSNYEMRRKGGLRPNTVFLDVHCQNWGALVTRSEMNETTTQQDVGTFRTTVHEFKMALELGLIEHVEVEAYIDNAELSDFSKHFVPIYEERQKVKQRLEDLRSQGLEDGPEWWEPYKEALYLKYLLNTGYGKFAQNPRRFKEWVVTDPDDAAPAGYEAQLGPSFRNELCAMWSKPASIMRGFNNVGTAASITGAARSILMRAIHVAIDPIYCDTDSIICKDLPGVEIDNVKLGAWKLEREISEIIINGKKLYAYKYLGKDRQSNETRVKSKGVSDVTWDDMVKMYDGAVLPFVNRAPTFDRTGRQYYMTRNVRATVARAAPGMTYAGSRERADISDISSGTLG